MTPTSDRPAPRRRDVGPLVGMMLAGVPLGIVGGFASQWWHPALWIGAVALVPGLLGALYAMALLTMIAERRHFWTGGIAIGAAIGLLFARGEPAGALGGALMFAAARVYAEAVTWAMARLGYGSALDS